MAKTQFRNVIYYAGRVYDFDELIIDDEFESYRAFPSAYLISITSQTRILFIVSYSS